MLFLRSMSGCRAPTQHQYVGNPGVSTQTKGYLKGSTAVSSLRTALPQERKLLDIEPNIDMEPYQLPSMLVLDSAVRTLCWSFLKGLTESVTTAWRLLSLYSVVRGRYSSLHEASTLCR